MINTFATSNCIQLQNMFLHGFRIVMETQHLFFINCTVYQEFEFKERASSYFYPKSNVDGCREWEIPFTPFGKLLREAIIL